MKYRVKTKMKKQFLAVAIALISALLPLKALAQQYDGLFIFGDSLVDNGNLFKLTGGAVPPSPPYFQGRFSNGFVWVERLQPLLGINANQTINFGLGGATSGATNALSGFLGTTLPSLPSELNSFPGSPDPKALYVLWAGANDYLIQTQPRPTDTSGVVNNLSNAATTLISKGARNLIVVNLPDLGKTPQEQALGTSASSTALTLSHNTNLRAALQTLAQQNPGVNIIPLDVNALFGEVNSDPARYGLTNITQPCFTGSAVCSNPDQYLFWDGVHPTATGHNIIAQYAAAVLNAPQAVVPQGDIALNVAKRPGQVIDARLLTLRNSPLTSSEQRLSAFLNGGVNFGDKNNSNSEPGYNFTTSGVTAGVDYRLTDNLALGVAVGYTGNDTDLSNNRGKIGVDGYAVSVYSNYSQKDFYASSLVSYGGNNFDIKRPTSFDNRTATGNPNGDQFSANVNGGYVAKSGNIAYGPTLGLRYDRANIDGYTETGAGSLNMKVKDQAAESLVMSVGVQAAITLDTGAAKFIPNIRASYEHQFANDSREIITELVTQPGIPMRTRTSEPDRDYLKLGAGTQMMFSKNFTAAIDYETVIGLRDVSDNRITGEIRYEF
jgi:outer membrane lipase/esterase